MGTTRAPSPAINTTDTNAQPLTTSDVGPIDGPSHATSASTTADLQQRMWTALTISSTGNNRRRKSDDPPEMDDLKTKVARQSKGKTPWEQNVLEKKWKQLLIQISSADAGRLEHGHDHALCTCGWTASIKKAPGDVDTLQSTGQCTWHELHSTPSYQAPRAGARCCVESCGRLTPHRPVEHRPPSESVVHLHQKNKRVRNK